VLPVLERKKRDGGVNHDSCENGEHHETGEKTNTKEIQNRGQSFDENTATKTAVRGEGTKTG